MKNFFRITAALVVLVSAGAINEASAQATATATATANIVTPISIAKTVDMNFGNIAVSASAGGEVVLNPAGVRSYNNGVTLPATTGTVTAASFTVTGQGSYTYAITLPASVTITSGGTNMLVEDFTSLPAATGSGTLSAGGTDILAVGAKLTVAAGQAAGTYVSGTPFSVTVNYN